MYQYYKGVLIREGTEGVASRQLRELYEKTGWCSPGMPQWQNEKFTVALRNSAWAFTVWDKEILAGMVRVVSDKVMVESLQDLMLLPEYRNKGIGKFLVSLCLQKLPDGEWSARTTPENYDFYIKCGFAMPDSNHAAMEYNGYTLARLRGDRP